MIMRVKLIYPQDMIKEPLLFRMATTYDIMPNIRRARVSETVGEIVLELEGDEDNLKKGIDFLRQQGVMVDMIEGDALDWAT